MSTISDNRTVNMLDNLQTPEIKMDIFVFMIFEAGTCHPAGSAPYAVQRPVVSFHVFVCFWLIL